MKHTRYNSVAITSFSLELFFFSLASCWGRVSSGLVLYFFFAEVWFATEQDMRPRAGSLVHDWRKADRSVQFDPIPRTHFFAHFCFLSRRAGPTVQLEDTLAAPRGPDLFVPHPMWMFTVTQR